MSISDLTDEQLASERASRASAQAQADAAFIATRDAALVAGRLEREAAAAAAAARATHQLNLTRLQRANRAVAQGDAEAERRDLDAQLAALAQDAPERADLQRQIAANADKRRRLGG